MDEKDSASRKWQLTFNNPAEHGWTHEKIREVLRTFKAMTYWCMADEIGGKEQTPHTHLFINLDSVYRKYMGLTAAELFYNMHIYLIADWCK